MVELKYSRNVASGLRASIILTLFFAIVRSGYAAGPEQISDSALAQISAMMQEKASRSPLERKLDSQFVFRLRQNRGQAIAAGVTGLRPDIQFEADGRVRVDIDATVTTNLIAQIKQTGGTVINYFPRFHAIRALVPLDQLETLAGSPDVKLIRRASQARHNTGLVDSEGDTTHRAAFARNNFGIDGTGVKVGVLSDSVTYLDVSQASGDLGEVTVLPGQDGYGEGEGTAMLEIVHDLAPGAQLYFATADNSEASFAQNILDLRSNGCDIIIDDTYYLDEPVFEDGVIADAVNTVTADGALYFSSAGNDGNFKDGTSCTWEGDFVDSGQPVPPVLRANGIGGKVHSFGATNYNTVVLSGYGVDLFWDDPLGASTNDYDLFELDTTGTYVIAASTNPQTGTQDPYENLYSAYPGAQLVIVKASGDPRFLHLDTSRGQLSYSTGGATRGHAAAANAFGVAAVSALSSYPGPFTGGNSNHVETFSSDGPRRVFFNADGTPITPGNFSSTGGAVRPKPDIAAADGVMTYVWGIYTGYGPFFGTSAAAPHAAAIAALLLSYDHTLTPDRIRAALTNSALDIEAPGLDGNSGAGIVMAEPALETLPPKPIVVIGTATLVNESCPDGAIDPGETVTVSLSLTNLGVVGTSQLVATLLETNGVTYPSAPQNYGALPAHGGTGTQLFTFIATGDCGGTNIATLQLQDGAMNLGAVSLPLQLGRPNVIYSENFDLVQPPALPSGWTVTQSGAGAPWMTTNSAYDTPFNSVFAPDPPATSDNELTSPSVFIPTSSTQLTFQHSYDIEPGYDFASLEISIGGGAYSDILAAGGSFVAGGYNYAGSGWSGDSFGFVGTTVNLPPGAVGKSVRFRWILTSDYSIGYVGWYVDSVSLMDGFTCCASATNNVVAGISAAPDPVVLGGLLTYTINIENTGPGPATGLNLTDLLPSNFTFQSLSLSPGVYPGPGQNAGDTLHFNIGTLAGGATETITISGTANAIGQLTNRISISRTDGGLITSSNATALTSVILPLISISDVSVMEDGTNADFNVSLSPAPATNVFVRFATRNVTALAATNYLATNGLLSFAPGVTNQTITVPVLDDLVDAPDLTFAVNLSNATNALINKTQGIGTIVNVDPEPYLYVSDATVAKPNVGTTNAVFNFSLSHVSGYTVTAYYNTSDGSAIGGLDYQPTNNSLTFMPGQTNLPVSVLVTNHISAKPSQSFYLYLESGSYAKIARGTGTGTVVTAFPGQFDHFSWDPISSPQAVSLPVPVTIRARDYFEGPSSNFNGTVSFIAASPLPNPVPPGSIVPYFTDNNPTDTGPAAPISRAGFLPLQVTNINTLVFRNYKILFIDESDNGSLSPSLSARLLAIQDWVNSGGKLIVHDRSAGYLSPNPFLLGTTGISTVRDETSDVDLIPPGTNLVVAGPFGTINNTTLDGGNSSAHGYVAAYQLPPFVSPILSIGGNSMDVVAFSYPLGQGQIYYSSIPLDFYLDIGGSSALSSALQNTYAPNVLAYTATLPASAPVTLSPTTSGAFTNGDWSGAITVQQTASNVTFFASDGSGHSGLSNPFDVIALLPPILLGVSVNSNAFQFSWGTLPGHSYQVQYKTNLTQSDWLNLGSPLMATNANLWFVQPIGPDPQRFFRLQLQ